MHFYYLFSSGASEPQWTCDIFVFRFYISRVAAGLPACMPAVSMITLTMWYFYDPFMHLDWENYPEYWPLSIVAAIYCNNYDFSSLKLKRVWTPQLDKTALFLSPFPAQYTSRFWSYLLNAWIDLQNSFCFHLITSKLDVWEGQKCFLLPWKKIRGPTHL